MSSFGKSPFTFKNKFGNKDMLFNKKKISSDVLSMSSASSRSSASSESSGTSSSSGGYKKKQEYEEEEEEFERSSQNSEQSEEMEEDEENSVDDQDDDASVNRYEAMRKESKHSLKNELNEKREILYQVERLESKGYKLPFKFTMESDLQEMKTEYNKLIREKEIDAGIRFQRKMLMAFVTGTEYLNTRYDPLSIRLEGWSEQVHETVTDYDDIFEELHNKYKSTGKKMSPELRLFISLSGSAFMFHLTSRMFKENPLPNVEHVLKSNPELMKQFQEAATRQYISGNVGPQQSNSSHPNMGGNSGIFGMVSNLFNNISGGASRQQMFRDDDEESTVSFRKQTKTHRDIDSIINNVHSKISLSNDDNNIETLSVSDEEITSIIEDTADIKILKNGKKNKNTRTLNL